MYERILVALDGSEVAERILPHVEALARAFGSTLVLLRATTSPETIVAELGAGELEPAAPIVDPTPIIEGEQQDADAYLGRVAGQLKAAGLTVETERPEGPASDAILDLATGSRIDLIAMTTHGRGGLGRLIFGSVAEGVLHKATCPVLLVRVHEA